MKADIALIAIILFIGALVMAGLRQNEIAGTLLVAGFIALLLGAARKN